MLNPEFRRNLWTELSLHKLVAMPVVLGAVFGLVGSLGEFFGDWQTNVRGAAAVSFAIFAFLLGTRRAAAAVVEEVQGGTWDSQRMSALNAWPMTWGKVIGSAIFSWYGAVLSLAVYLVTAAGLGDISDALRLVYLMVLAGLIAQATALAMSLAYLRQRGDRKRVSVTACQAMGLVAVVIQDPSNILPPWEIFEFDLPYRAVEWYGANFDSFTFAVIFRSAFLAWAVLAAYRLMRVELQHRTYPWAWGAFSIYLMTYLGGFWFLKGENTPAGWLSAAFLVAAAVVYAAFLLEDKNVVILKALAGAVRAGEWIKAVALTPSWAVCLVLALLVGAALAGVIGSQAINNPFRYSSPMSFISPSLIVAAALFLLRDIGFLLFMNVATRSRRPDGTGLIYLIVLYGVGGGLLTQLDLDAALSFVTPYDTGNAVLTIAPVLAQVAAVYALLVYRLRGTLRPAIA